LTLVDHGETGLLPDDRAPARCAAHIDRLLTDRPLAAEMGRRAASRASGYRWSISGARLRRLYADLTTRTPVDCAG
jgi:glycosyltransferase involved in cell wall biosynthesis